MSFDTTECGDLDECVFLDSLGDLGGFNGEGADKFGLAGVLFWAFSSVAFGIIRDWLAGYELTKG